MRKNSLATEGIMIGLIAAGGAFHIAKYFEIWWLIVPVFILLALILLWVAEA